MAELSVDELVSRLDSDHPIITELSSLRSTLARYQHELHTSTLKHQRTALETSQALDRAHRLERENDVLRTELAALRTHPDITPHPSTLQATELSLALRHISDKLTATEETLLLRTKERTYTYSSLRRAEEELAHAKRDVQSARDSEREAWAREREHRHELQLAQEECRLRDVALQQYADLIRKLDVSRGTSSNASSSSSTLASEYGPTSEKGDIGYDEDLDVSAPPRHLQQSQVELSHHLASFHAESSHFEEEMSRLHDQLEDAASMTEALTQAHEIDRTRLAELELAADRTRIDDGTSAKMVSRYMKFSQTSTNTLQSALSALKTRHAASLDTLVSQVSALSKSLSLERATVESLRAALEDANEDVAREAVGRRREVALRLKALGREERVAEMLGRCKRRAGEGLDIFLRGRGGELTDEEERDADADLKADIQHARATITKLFADMDGVLGLLHGHVDPDGKPEIAPGRSSAGSLARVLLAEDLARRLGEELDSEVQRWRELNYALSEESAVPLVSVEESVNHDGTSSSESLEMSIEPTTELATQSAAAQRSMPEAINHADELGSEDHVNSAAAAVSSISKPVPISLPAPVPALPPASEPLPISVIMAADPPAAPMPADNLPAHPSTSTSPPPAPAPVPLGSATLETLSKTTSPVDPPLHNPSLPTLAVATPPLQLLSTGLQDSAIDVSPFLVIPGTSSPKHHGANPVVRSSSEEHRSEPYDSSNSTISSSLTSQDEIEETVIGNMARQTSDLAHLPLLPLLNKHHDGGIGKDHSTMKEDPHAQDVHFRENSEDASADSAESHDVFVSAGLIESDMPVGYISPTREGATGISDDSRSMQDPSHSNDAPHVEDKPSLSLPSLTGDTQDFGALPTGSLHAKSDEPISFIPSTDVPQERFPSPLLHVAPTINEPPPPFDLSDDPSDFLISQDTHELDLVAQPSLHPLLGHMREVASRYETLSRSFHDCHLALRDLKAKLSMPEDNGDFDSTAATTLSTVVNRLDDVNEDVRVELEIQVADEARLVEGYTALLSLPGHLASLDTAERRETEQEIEAFISGTNAKISRAMTTFARKRDDLEHDVAAAKRALHNAATGTDSPNVSPNVSTTALNPESDADGSLGLEAPRGRKWSAWTGGLFASSRPASPAPPSFGTFMSTPHLRKAASSASLASQYSNPNASTSTSEPLARLGLQLMTPMPTQLSTPRPITPTHVAHNVPRPRYPSMFGQSMLGVGMSMGVGVGAGSARSMSPFGRVGTGIVPRSTSSPFPAFSGPRASFSGATASPLADLQEQNSSVASPTDDDVE